MKNFVFFVITSLLPLFIVGQDVHFSQFYNSPLTLNPAMTGLMNYDIRFIANYRNQWASVTKPYQTIAASADASILKGFMEGDFFGGGLQLVNDKAGDSEFRTTQVQIAASYSKSLSGDANHFVTFGSQLGFVTRGVDYTKLTFDSQYDGDVLNQGLASGEDVDRYQYSYIDFSAGLAWFLAPSEYSNLYAGIALAHLNEPNVSFFEGVRENLYKKTTIHFGAELGFNESVAFIPTGVILLQGPHKEINFGASLKLNLTPGQEIDEGAMALYFGTMHRFKDAQILVSRVDIGPVGISLSYDLNVSTLARATKSNGGPEIALIYRSNLWQDDQRGKSGSVRCPKF